MGESSLQTGSAWGRSFGALDARRWLILGGIFLIAGGMLFGDLFAVFILHPNARLQGVALMAAANAAAAKDAAGVGSAFGELGSLLEGRGTKVDTHVHMTDIGYLCLLLALAQPYVLLGEGLKRKLAQWFVVMGFLLPIGIFSIHYVGLAYSPFPVIGWASVLADVSGLVAMILLSVEAWGVWQYFRAGAATPEVPSENSWSRRALLSGGTVLVLLGFLYGSGYAALNLYEHEAREVTILRGLLGAASNADTAAMNAQGAAFGMLAGEKAVQIAAHAHFVEFGLLALMLSFIQGYVGLQERWKRRMAILVLLGGLILPIAVSMELQYGLLAGGIADAGGLLVIIGMMGMLAGVLRFSGAVDAGEVGR